MTNNELIAKVRAIYSRYYRRLLWFGIKLIALFVSIGFLWYGYCIDNTKIGVLSFLSSALCLYLVLFSIGIDPSGDPEPTLWEERKNSLGLLIEQN